MAPEWVLNQHITSKVDLYSYGILTLEMITGRSPICVCRSRNDSGGHEKKMLVTWPKEKMQATTEKGKAWWIGEIADSRINERLLRMETLVQVALQCVEEDENARLSMCQVVEMLVGNETDE